MFCLGQPIADTSRSSGGLSIENDGKIITQNSATATHKMSLAVVGYKSGDKVFYAYLVVDKGVHSHIMIGASDGVAPGILTNSYHPGMSADKGVALYGNNGHRYYSATNSGMAGSRLLTGHSNADQNCSCLYPSLVTLAKQGRHSQQGTKLACFSTSRQEQCPSTRTARASVLQLALRFSRRASTSPPSPCMSSGRRSLPWHHLLLSPLPHLRPQWPH